MPRIGRAPSGGVVQHVLNRGNGRMALFQKPGDYAAFTALLAEAAGRFPGVRLCGWCLMPNHWHLVPWPTADGELPRFMHWLSNAHVRRWRQHWHTVGGGHVYQGRYKGFPVQDDPHYLTLLRYVEANPVHAGLVARAQDWPWSSLRADGLVTRGGRPVLSPGPLDRPSGWLGAVNEPLPGPTLASVRTSVARGRPFGSDAWVRDTAGRLGLGFTPRGRGRPMMVVAEKMSVPFCHWYLEPQVDGSVIYDLYILNGKTFDFAPKASHSYPQHCFAAGREIQAAEPHQEFSVIYKLEFKGQTKAGFIHKPY